MTDDVKRALGTGAKCDDPSCDLCVAARAAADEFHLITEDVSPVEPTSEPDPVSLPPVFADPAPVVELHDEHQDDA